MKRRDITPIANTMPMTATVKISDNAAENGQSCTPTAC